ncbi:MAG: DUF4013 domain-containing protein [Anaerolineae bacterium]|nr:DUF4013 domain-containing protein [Anaerolineae bacterium]
MNFGLAFSYQFQDPDWIKKILLNGLITLIPVVGPFYLTGWMLEIASRFAKSDDVLLPEIDFGKYISKGFMAMVIGLIYMLPTLIIILPAIVVPMIFINNGDDTVATIMVILMICCYGLGLLVSIAAGLLQMVAIVEFALKDFKAAFQFKTLFAIFKAAIGPYLLTILVAAFGVPIITSLGGIACGIGVLFTAPYSVTVMASMLGQAHRAGANAQVVEL